MTLDPSKHDTTSGLLGDFDASERPMVTPIVQGLADRMSRVSLDDAARDRIGRSIRSAIAEKADRAQPSHASGGWGSLLRSLGPGLAGAAVAIVATIIILPSFLTQRSATITGTTPLAPATENLRGRSFEGTSPADGANDTVLRSEDAVPLDAPGSLSADQDVAREATLSAPIAVPAPAPTPLATGSTGDAQGGVAAQKTTLAPPTDISAPIFRVRPPVYRIVRADDPSTSGTTMEVVDFPMFTPRDLEVKIQALVSSRDWMYDPTSVHLEYETTGDYLMPVLVFTGPDGKVTQAFVVDTLPQP